MPLSVTALLLLSANDTVSPVALIVPIAPIALPEFVSVVLPEVFVNDKVPAVIAPDCVKPPATLSVKLKVWPAALTVPICVMALLVLVNVVAPTVFVTFNVPAVIPPAVIWLIVPLVLSVKLTAPVPEFKVWLSVRPPDVVRLKAPLPALVEIPLTLLTVPTVKAEPLVKLKPELVAFVMLAAKVPTALAPFKVALLALSPK